MSLKNLYVLLFPSRTVQIRQDKYRIRSDCDQIRIPSVSERIQIGGQIVPAPPQKMNNIWSDLSQPYDNIRSERLLRSEQHLPRPGPDPAGTVRSQQGNLSQIACSVLTRSLQIRYDSDRCRTRSCVVVPIWPDFYVLSDRLRTDHIGEDRLRSARNRPIW